MAATSIYNVVDYGAVGDGATDDTKAIQTAINHSVQASPAGGGICYVPPGVFLLATGTPNLPILTLPTNCHLRIDGEIRVGAPPNGGTIEITGSNVLIEGAGTINGNRSNGFTTPYGIYSPDGLAPLSNITISGIAVTDVSGSGITLKKVNGGRLRSLTISNCGVANQFALGCTNCTAEHLTITGATDYGFAFYNGCANCAIVDSYLSGNNINVGVLTDNNAPNPVSSSHITILGNTCIGAAGPAIHIGTAGVLPAVIHTDILIAGNKVHGNQLGIQVTSTMRARVTGNTCHADYGDEILIGDPNSAVGCTAVTVTKNRCYASVLAGGGAGIAVRAQLPTGVSFAPAVPRHRDIAIAGNQTYDNASYGIFVSCVTNCTIIGNQGHGDRGAEICIGPGVVYPHKHGNVARDVVPDSTDTAVAELDGGGLYGPARLAMTHNHIWSLDGQMTYALQGGPNNNAFVHGNIWGGWAIAATAYDVSGLNFQQSANFGRVVGGPTAIGTTASPPQVGTFAFGTAQTVPAGAKVLAPPWASVQDFGAVGDGVSDDTAAIAAALGYAQAKGVPLYLPAGTYRLTATLPPITAAGLRIFGDGPALSVLVQGAAAATQGLTLNAPHLTVEGLGFTGAAGTTGWNGVVCQSGAPFPTLRDCHFQTYASATAVGGAIVFANTTGGLIVYAHILGCRFFGPAGGLASAIYIDDGYDDLVIEGCGFGLAGGGSLAPSGGVTAGTAGGVAGVTITGCLFCEDNTPVCIQAQNCWTVVGCIFESVQTAVALVATTYVTGRVAVVGNTFQLWDVASTGVPCVDASRLGAGDPVAVTGNAFNGAQGTGPAILLTPGSGTQAVVVGNTFIGSGVPSAADLSGAAVVADNAGLGVTWSTTPPAVEAPLSTTALTTILTFTPAQDGTFQIDTYLRVEIGPTTVSAQVTYTDAAGAQTTVLVNAVPAPVGSYHVPALTLASVAGQPITVQAQADIASQVFVSASLKET